MEFPNQNEEYGNEEAYDEGIETEDGGSPENASKRKEVPKSADSSVRGSRAKKKNPSTRSWVWEHYTREPDNRNICRCHYCGRSMACATANGTTCLKNHLEICKEYQAWNESNQGQQHVLHREGEGDDESSKLKLSKCSESVFREASNEMLVLGELPLSFIESLAWKHFCSKVKLYKPHSRRTATRDIVEMYVRKKEAMMKLLKSNKQRVSLTTDIWVAPTTGASYMVITAHFIDASWQLRKLTIGFKHISDHTEMVKETGFQDSSTELELYLKEKIEIPKANPLGIQFDVLGWWRINSAKYPVLSTLAKDLLAMQVSSVASESAFSTSNRILDPFRSCLTHYMVEVLMCTEQWLKCEIRINERGVVTCQQMLADLELQDDLQKEYDAPRNLEDY
ncbi:Ribonuclease H-like superfamily [Arabidopsis thaliana x Arabidopsis arenosa]|uniref:Ribonuclease H-like superfamily n=1 Tax=Arabidopsis thaliana x Arabidopsis arenosa TaxID=1240361 RepID=A0A8T1Y8U3_9BRAS|nr:Ribonuclease H-like superfamily [Arabidopsis thaliana x Arabidopsis arenosa]